MERVYGGLRLTRVARAKAPIEVDAPINGRGR